MPATENIFNDKFWDSQDFITNALDNIKARLYVDSKCVEHAKPLLESGTLGTKCNTVIVVPYKTKSYGDGTDAKEGGNEAEIPMCTLRNFPTLLDHCVEWSRAQFTDLFVEPMKRTKMFSDNPDAYLKKLESHLGDDPLLRSQRSKDLEAMRSVRGQKHFNHITQILRITHSYHCRLENYEYHLCNSLKSLLSCTLECDEILNSRFGARTQVQTGTVRSSELL